MISIIIPIYNSATTIEKCIFSILNQTYTDFEIIIVDDCSTDNTGDVLCKLHKLDNRIKIHQLQENKGVGCARNFALSVSTGEYVGFVDSDDGIKPDYYETMLNTLLKTNSDIISSGMEMDRVNKTILVSGSYKEYIGFDCLKYRTEEFRDICPDFFLINKLFKKELFDKISLSNLRMLEDFCSFGKILYYCKKLTRIPYIGYHYSWTETSITHCFGIKRKVIYQILAGFEVWEFFRDKEKEYKDFISDKAQSATIYFDIYKSKSMLDKIKIEFPKEYKQIEEYKKLYYDELSKYLK